MKRTLKSIEKSSSISASILSLALTLIGFTNFELSVWWHFCLVAIILLILYAFFLVSIEIIIHLYQKHIKRAYITSDINEELNELEKFSHDLYKKHIEYENSSIITYKEVLKKEILNLLSIISSKIVFIERLGNSPTFKNKSQLPNNNLFEEYKKFYETIKEKYNI